MKYVLKVTPEHNNKRSDIIIPLMLDITRSAFKNRFVKDTLFINGQKKPLSYVSQAGDEIALELEEQKVPSLIPQNIPLSILYEDKSIVVINKQKGIVIHAGGGAFDNTLVNALLYHIKDFEKFEGDSAFRPGIVHRLDKDTSGVMVVAKNSKALLKLQKQFSSRTIQKEYRAIVISNIAEDEIIIDQAIGRSQNDRKKMGIHGINERAAYTEVMVKERFQEYTYVAAFPKTGRTHQVRVHLASIKHPILGDSVYGSKNIPLRFKNTVSRVLLHAYKLTFAHPETGEMMTFTAPIPEDMENILNILRLKQK